MTIKYLPLLFKILFALWLVACKSAVPTLSIVPKEKDKPLKIVVISDLNASYGATEYPAEVPYVIAQLDSIRPDIILCAGDMVAGQKATLTEENIRAMWAGFKTTVLDPVEKLQIPFGFTVGNHDASPSFALDRRLSQEFWQQHAGATHLSFVDSAHYPFYFSYTKSGVFFISWDAAGAVVPAEVYQWMERQLKSSAATSARLRILLGHLPLYAIVESKNKPGEVNAAPDSALHFFKQNGIDVYISGHQHAYYPAKKEGVKLFNAGAIGNGPRPILGSNTPAQKAYSIIEIPVRRANNFSHQTFDPVTKSNIDMRLLPDSVVGFNGVVYRQD